MLQRQVVVKNRAGIHCRPASVILNTINAEFPDDRFELDAGEEVIELNSILSLISLGLPPGKEVVLKVERPNAEKALKKIGDLLMFEFDFPAQ